MRLLFTRCLSALAMVACQGASSASSSAQSSPQQLETATTSINASRRTAITQAVARVAPSVVTVQTEVVEQVPADVFEQFFGGRSGQRSAAGLGSGFIVRVDGAILTNAHVVAGATRISVALKDGTSYPARLIGIDETNDLAVLKIDGHELPTVTLGNSDQLGVGDYVLASADAFLHFNSVICSRSERYLALFEAVLPCLNENERLSLDKLNCGFRHNKHLA